MRIQGFDISKQIAEIEEALKSEKNLSPVMVSMRVQPLTMWISYLLAPYLSILDQN